MPNDVSREAGPAAWDLLIRNTRLLDRDDPVDIAVRDGLVAAMAGNIGGTSARTIDAAGGLSTPSFNEPHFHLDKVLSRHLHGAVSFHEAFARARDVKKQFTAGDVEERACRALDLALAQGTARMRAHVDVDFATGTVSMEGILAARERYRGAIDLQVIAFPQEGIVTDPEAPDLLREAVAMGAEFIGGLPEFEASVEDQKVHVDTIFDLAEECDVGLDIHCDYTDTPDLRTLEMVTDVTRERGMQGRVFAGHCNALSLYSDDHARAVIDKVVESDIQVAVLPIANLQMLGGPHRTPMNRGSSRLLEMLDAGLNVAAGADNMFDIWYRFNCMDPLQTGLIACLSGGMRTDEEVREAFDLVTVRAARYLGAGDTGLAVGAPADLVVHDAATLVELFRDLPGRRLHVRNGRIVGGVEGSFWSAP